jgi:hypothetical protein
LEHKQSQHLGVESECEKDRLCAAVGIAGDKPERPALRPRLEFIAIVCPSGLAAAGRSRALMMPQHYPKTPCASGHGGLVHNKNPRRS